ncbi:hypothetical protein EDB19DRAFT_1792532, partial [Suillus lakei]
MRCNLVLCFLFGMIIDLFVHMTCPSSEVFRCLPRHKEIFDGMLGTNLICSSRGTMAASHRCAGIFGGRHCALSGWGGSGEDCGGYMSFCCVFLSVGVLMCIYMRARHS